MSAVVTELHPEPAGHVPPQDIAAEQATLGCCLLSADAIDDAVDAGLRGRDFYRPDHEAIWEAARSMRSAGTPVDALTVADELTKRGELARVGGFAYLHTLMASAPTGALVGHYARIVRERAILRRLVTAGTRIVQLGSVPGGGSVAEIVNAASAELAAVADTVHIAVDETLADVAARALESIEAAEPAVPTPWGVVNDVVDGIRPARFYAVGGRPGTGKTMFGLQWAVSHARHGRNGGGQVVYFTFEMTAERLYQRALSAASGVSAIDIRRGRLTDGQWKAIIAADGNLQELPLMLVGSSGWSAQQIRAKARMQARRRPVGLLVVDHIGLTRPERSGGRENRQAELSEAADVMLATAHELGAAVLVLTQLNRGPTSRSDPRPIPSDIRDTDRIEQNADVLILLHREKENHPDELWVHIAKNRDGAESQVKLTFGGSSCQIVEPVWTPHSAIGGRP